MPHAHAKGFVVLARIVRVRRIACVPVILAIVQTRAISQAVSPPPRSTQALRIPLTQERPAWITRRELKAFGLALFATAAVAPLDKPVANAVETPALAGNGTLRQAATTLAFLGGPGPFIAGGAFYVAGSLTRQAPLTAVGLHLTEAVVMAAAINGLGKGMTGRALPGVKASEHFEWGRGFHARNGAYVAFPSGHTAAGFAMAATLTQECSYWHPGSEHYVGPIAYATATSIGFARVYQHVHWVSDLPLGAAIGIWSGLTVTAHAHVARANPLDTATAPSSVMQHMVAHLTVLPTGTDRVGLGWSTSFR